MPNSEFDLQNLESIIWYKYKSMLRQAVTNANGWSWIHMFASAKEHVSIPIAFAIAIACLCTHDKAVYLIFISVGPMEQK